MFTFIQIAFSSQLRVRFSQSILNVELKKVDTVERDLGRGCAERLGS